MRSINDRLRLGMDVAASGTNSSGPTMIGRAWFTLPGETDDPYQVPEGTRFIIARGVGAGGGCFNGSYNGGGGSSAYARHSFALNPGDNLIYRVGKHNVDANGGDTRLFVQPASGSAYMVLFVDGGNASTPSTPAGSPGQRLIGPAFPVMDVQVAGGFGGSAGGADCPADFGEIDILNLGGRGATQTASSFGFGAGAAIIQTGVSTFSKKPGRDGVLVLEFWTGDPR